MNTKKVYLGFQKEPFTSCERDKLKRLKACNDNELSDCERDEKARLLAKELEEFKNMGSGI